MNQSVSVAYLLSLCVLALGTLLMQRVWPAPVPVTPGAISLQLDGVDPAWLRSLEEQPVPEQASAAYGGSSVAQSPRYDLATWQQLLRNELE